MLGNKSSRFDARWLLTYFLFFFNLVEKNLLRVKKISKCCENGIACLRKGKLQRRLSVSVIRKLQHRVAFLKLLFPFPTEQFFDQYVSKLFAHRWVQGDILQG